MKVKEKILQLKKKKKAVILAHNYQRSEVQELADFVGDSLELAKQATQVDADLVVMCGVDFMAETVCILNPDKKVLIPDVGSICSMAQMLTPEQLRRAKEENRGAEVVLYVNTTADCKALADCICTSANAPQVVGAMESEVVLFGPDRNLAEYVRRRTEKRVLSVPEYGLCPVHHQLSVEDVRKAKAKHPQAELVVHPECIPEVQDLADHIASTSGMVKYCSQSSRGEFLIGTEEGLLHRLRRECPEKRFHLVSPYLVCPQMKMHTLGKIQRALELEKPEVKIEKGVAEAARRAVERMLSLV